MNPLVLFWNREVPVFHVRAGGCGGCGDIVDNWIRFSGGSSWRPVECLSPRHAGLIIITGCNSESCEEAALSVVEQAPEGCRVLLVGDCGRGLGPFIDENEKAARSAVEGRADSAVEGCPVEEDSIVRGVKSCLGWS